MGSSYVATQQFKTPIPFTFEKDTTLSGVESSRDLESDINAGRTVFGLMLNQHYGSNSEGGLNRLNIKIKGDPYWLGYTNTDIDKMPGSAEVGTTGELPLFWNKHELVAVHFKYPVQVKDNGDPELRSSEVYSGIFSVFSVQNDFTDGKFSQTLIGARQRTITIDPKILDQ